MRIFSVRKANVNVPDFSSALVGIFQLTLAEREHNLGDDVMIRLERLENRRGFQSGELIRLQVSDLPSEAQTGIPVRPLGVASIGHSTVFAYHATSGLLAFQLARNGITSSKFASYVNQRITGANFDILPVPSEDIAERLRSGRVKALRIRTKAGENINAVDNRTRGVNEGFRAFRDALGTSIIDVTLSNGRDSVVPQETVLGMFSWLRRHIESGSIRGTYLQAEIVGPVGGQPEWLDLLGGQMGERTRLELAGDDPFGNYQIRRGFVEDVLRRHQAVAEGQSDE